MTLTTHGRFLVATLSLSLLAAVPGCTLMRRALPGAAGSAVASPESPLRQTALTSRDQAHVCLQTALQLAASEKDEHALAQLKKARTLDPTLPGVAHPLAVLYDRQGQFGFAELEYERAMEEGVTADLLNDFGYFRFSQGNLMAARQLLTQARELAPQHPQATLNLAMVTAAEQDYESALTLFEDVVGLAAAHQNVGLLMISHGQTRSARRHLSQAVRLDPSLETAAEVLARLGTEL